MSVFDVANYFLTRVEVEAGSVMTHLKLQKLCFYAQVWHTVFTGKPMFNERFEAWAHGPVSPRLWQEYKGYSYHPIPAPETFDFGIFTDAQLKTLKEVWDAYGDYDAKYLERLTHSEEPWIMSRESCLPGAACDNEITLDSMREYYSQLYNEALEGR